MKPPKSIQVGAARYAVSYDTSLYDDSAVGRLVRPKQQILLQPGQVGAYEQDTVLHEVLHAIFFHSAFSNVASLDTEKEESAVQMLTPLLLDTIKRNPKLIAYLTEPA